MNIALEDWGAEEAFLETSPVRGQEFKPSASRVSSKTRETQNASESLPAADSPLA